MKFFVEWVDGTSTRRSLSDGPEWAIPADSPTGACIQRLIAGVCEVREEMTKVQMELNFLIVELGLKA